MLVCIIAAYVLSGKIRVWTGKDLSEVAEFSPDDAFLIKKEKIHREEIVGDVPCETITAHIKDFKTVQV